MTMALMRESEILAPARVDMKEFLARLSTDEGIQEQQQLAAAYDRACRALIGPNDIQTEGDREFKKKSAWRKLQRHFTISTAVVNASEKFVTGDDGELIFIAIVTVRAMAPWGQYAEAVGACATDEESGQRVITISDALATAETRATNRSVSNLIAMGEVSAEEMSKGNGAAGGTRRGEKDPAEMKIPFGPSKGTKLKDIATGDLEGALEWAEDKAKFDDFQKAAKAVLAARRNPVKPAEQPAATATATAATAPARDLAWAKGYPIPWPSHKHFKDPIDTRAIDELEKALSWAIDKIEEAGASGRELGPGDMPVDFRDALRLVIADKKAIAEKDQTKLELETPLAEPAPLFDATKKAESPPTSTSVPVPPPGKVFDAIQPIDDPTSVRAMQQRAKVALESPAVNAELREKYRLAQVNGFKRPHNTLQWWVKELEGVVARAKEAETFPTALESPDNDGLPF